MNMSENISNDEFDKLSFEEQCRVIYQSPLEKKAELIIRSQAPEDIVSSFSSEELYLIAKEAGCSNLPELVQSANVNQLQFMADFECWKDEVIDEKGFVDWLQYLLDAGNERLKIWLLSSDFDFLIAGFQKTITVLKPSHEEAVDDVLGDNPYFTIDGLYYILINNDNLFVVKSSFSILFDCAKKLYYGLLEGILSETGSIVEEEALRYRKVRLAEKGFPDKEYAYNIYRPLSEASWNKYSFRDNTAEVIVSDDILPLYPTLWNDEKLFLDDVMATLHQDSREVQRVVYQEMVYLCNKIIACNELDGFSQQKVEYAYYHARHILSLSFEVLSGGDLNLAHNILITRWMEYVFRQGITTLLELRDQAEKIIKGNWPFSMEMVFNFFDAPYGSILRGLLRSKPQYFDKNYSEDLFFLRDFKSSREVYEVREQLGCLEQVFKFLNTPICKGWDYFSEEDDFDEIEHPQFSKIFLTLFAEYVVNDKLALNYLSASEVKHFIGLAFSSSELFFNPDIKAQFLQELFKRIVDFVSQEEYVLMGPLFELAFNKGEEELGLLDMNVKINKKYIHCLFISSKNG